MKKFMVFIICCLAFILTSTGDSSASPYLDIPSSAMLWKVEPLIQDNDVASIAVGYYEWTRAPRVDYYTTPNQRLNFANYVGKGLGDCGVNNGWECYVLEADFSQYHDMAHFQSDDNNYFESGIASYRTDNTMHFSYAYRQGNSFGANFVIVLDLDYFPSGVIGSQPSLTYDANHKAHLVFIIDGDPNDYLIYAHDVGTGGNSCADYGGSEYWQCDQILVGPNIAADPNIALVSGSSPRIAYYDPGLKNLNYAYPSGMMPNCGPSNDWRCVIIDARGDTGRFPSIAIDEARYIAYYDYMAGDLMMAKFVGSNGNCGNDWNGFDLVNRWQCDAIESIGLGITKMGLALVMDGAEPIVAYQDKNDYDTSSVKIAQSFQRMGMDYGNCGPENPFPTWYCQTIVLSQYNLGSEIDLTISHEGALFMGFLEQDDADYETHLWVARQYFQGFLPVLEK